MQLTLVVHGELLHCVGHRVGRCCLLTRLISEKKASVYLCLLLGGFLQLLALDYIFLVFFFFQVLGPTPLSFLTIFFLSF